MEIRQTIRVSRSPDAVWAMLGNVPEIAACIPGAELGTELGDGRYSGSFKLKVGPLTAKIDGEGKMERNDSARRGRIVGRGIDRRGGSRVAVRLDYEVLPDPAGAVIDVVAETDISGPLAQIGRTGIIEDVARRITTEFSTALEARLTAQPIRPETEPAAIASGKKEFDVGRAITASIASRLLQFIKRIFEIR